MTQHAPEAPTLMELFRAIASGNAPRFRELLSAVPGLAHDVLVVDATREDPTTYFLDRIQHYVYAGDTALHVAAAAYRVDFAEALLAHGASTRARNRRGAEPLHYAADGGPGSRTWNPDAQAAVITRLCRAGADPNAADKSGVAPLHRAVRTRCASAVRALLEAGADPNLKNGSGSTPLHLAVQNTGRGGSGYPEAREQQREILLLLLEHGARRDATDARGKTAEESATFDAIRALFRR